MQRLPVPDVRLDAGHDHAQQRQPQGLRQQPLLVRHGQVVSRGHGRGAAAGFPFGEDAGVLPALRRVEATQQDVFVRAGVKREGYDGLTRLLVETVAGWLPLATTANVRRPFSIRKTSELFGSRPARPSAGRYA